MGRAGWAASVTALSPAGLWRKPLGPRRTGLALLGAPGCARSISLALRSPAAAPSGCSPPSPPTPSGSRPETGRELVLGWIDASGYDGANRAMRTHVFDPTGYPADVPVTLAWGELDRLVAPPRPERRPAGARFLVLPGVGHTPTWDDPELVARTLLEGSESGRVPVTPPKEEQR